MSSSKEKILYLIFDIVCVLLLLFALFVSITSISFRANGYSKLFTTTYFYTETADMSPQIDQGEFVVAKEMDEYFKGDIVAYNSKYLSQEKFALGKIISVSDECYRVCGINEASSTVELTHDEIVGKMIGQNETAEKIVNALSDVVPALTYVIIPTVITLFYGLVRLAFALKSRKQTQEK